MKKIPPIKELKEICKKRDEVYWRDKLNRSITIRFTKVFLHLGATPDQLTLLSLIVGLISISFFSVGSYGFILLAVFFHHLSHVLDGCDGEIARFDPKKRTGKGPYLEALSYFILFPLMYMAMGIGAYFNNPLQIPSYLFLIFGFVGTYFMFLNGLVIPIRNEHYFEKGNFKSLRNIAKKKKVSELESQFRFLLNPGEIFNIVFFAGLLNLVWLLVIFNALWHLLMFIRKLIKVSRGLDKDFVNESKK